MSEIILPPGISLPRHIQPMEAPEADATAEEKAAVSAAPAGRKSASAAY